MPRGRSLHDRNRCQAEAPNYGIDAPTAVRNLILGGAAALVLAVVSYLLDWGLTRMATGIAIGWLIVAGWMVWDSKVGKLWSRDRLLDGLNLRGDETVLDVGCGRGLLLIGAAKRLTTGKAVGVDIWQTEDLSGNRPEATLENARLEGVAERSRGQGRRRPPAPVRRRRLRRDRHEGGAAQHL